MKAHEKKIVNRKNRKRKRAGKSKELRHPKSIGHSVGSRIYRPVFHNFRQQHARWRDVMVSIQCLYPHTEDAVRVGHITMGSPRAACLSLFCTPRRHATARPLHCSCCLMCTTAGSRHPILICGRKVDTFKNVGVTMSWWRPPDSISSSSGNFQRCVTERI